MKDGMGFWEARAQRYAVEGAGLRAVCSYAMPWFYNRAIDITQQSALRAMIRGIPAGARVLEYGCGVGRWTCQIARRGAVVTAVDFSPTMLAEAERRVREAGVAASCSFVHKNLCDLALTPQYDVIIGVTVLQHVLDEAEFAGILRQFARGLKPGGRLIMVEAAPSRTYGHCDTRTFRARPLRSYLEQVAAAGLAVERIAGIDPMPFKLWVVPRFRRWPKFLAVAALGLATLLALPLDLLLAGVLTRLSWHKLIVAAAPEAA